jgi:Na+-transporting methylmalonyl-CoA/oxaloacetate decarboxylase beta subunit
MVKKMNKGLLFAVLVLIMILLIPIEPKATPLILIPIVFTWIYANN